MVGNFDMQMSTRSEIIKIGDELIRDKGYNAFSFYNISRAMGIKNASIHYHFPTKTDLGIAIVEEQIAALEGLIADSADKSPVERLKQYQSIYSRAQAENKVCLVGSLATDINSVDPEIRAHLKVMVDRILEWVTDILKDGRDQGIFHFAAPPRTKALLVISTMLASLQLTRLTGERDFNTIKDTVIKELKA